MRGTLRQRELRNLWWSRRSLHCAKHVERTRVVVAPLLGHLAAFSAHAPRLPLRSPEPLIKPTAIACWAEAKFRDHLRSAAIAGPAQL